MRRIWLMLPAALTIGCSDKTLSTAPAIDEPPTHLDAVATAVVAGVPAPIDGDRILIDSRTTLQQATNKTQAARAVGAQWLEWPWAFTTNVDGQGTNALRIDWPRRWNKCTYEVASLPIVLPAPKPTRIAVQWRQHLGRTATGGGVGTIGAFELTGHACATGRRAWTLLRADGSDGGGRIDYEWTGVAPVAPTVIRRGSPALRVDPLASVSLESFAGRTITQTLYAQAESAPGAADGIVALWIDATLVLAKTGLALDADAFRRMTFPGRMPVARQRQSEYFWDVLVWEPTASLPIPEDVPPDPPVVGSVTVVPASARLPVGATIDLAATVRDSEGDILTGLPLTWQSSDDAIASVSATGTVTALGVGDVTVTASTAGKSGTSAITVDPAAPIPVSSVQVSPPTATIQVGVTVQLTAVARDADGNALAGRAMAWSSASEGIATVNESGLVTAVAAGAATITATSEGVSGTSAVTVTPPPPTPVASVTVSPATASVAVGSAVQLTAVARDAAGNTLSGRSFTWSSGTPSIASVSGSGLVTGVATGSAVITATSEGVNGTSTVSVTGPPPPPPDATPPSAPQNLVALAVSPTQVSLTWVASTDNVGVTGYRVFRNGTQVGAPAAPAFQDGGLSPSTSYSYTVAAVDAAGNVSAPSAPVSATTPGTGGVGSALPARLSLSTGAVFYVAPNGSDSDAGSLTAPWRTIQRALNTLQPGQKAYVRAGTYREALTMNRAGTASAPITIEAYPGERPIIDGELTRRPLVIQSGGAYFRIKGFILDRDCCTSGGHIDVYGHHIEIVGNEMRNGRGKGVYTEEASRNVHIIDNWIHHNVTSGGQQDHGIYLQGNDHFVANNVIHDHPDGFGIQIYDRGARMIVVNNTVTNNGHSGIVVGGSGGVSDVIIRNNILANNSLYGVQHDSSCPIANVLVENNVIFGNGSGGVHGGCSSISASGNVTANPLFVNPGTSSGRDLRVQAGSPAINSARLDFAMPTAFGGASRGLQPDIGAYEFGLP